MQQSQACFPQFLQSLQHSQLAIGTDALALGFLAGVTTPWARVLRLTTDLTAVAGLLRTPAYAAAATRVVNLRSSTVYAASTISVLI